MDFSAEKMKKFADQDAGITFVFTDLMARGIEEEEALEIVFNSYVLEDSLMEDIYQSL